MNEPCLYSIRTLSPIHIGCGDEYEPTAFVIDEKSSRLISFDPLDFLDGLSAHDKARFVEICRRGTIGSIIELYKFMRGRKMKGTEIEVSPGFLAHWQKTLLISPQDERKIREELNRFGISRTTFSPADNRPYIPGSAIKGALRTAYLNALSKNEKTQPQQNDIKPRDLERMLLGGSFETDPFRMLKVSDFHPLGDVKSKILYAVNKKKKISKPARGPSQILEAIEAGSLFVGTIAVAEPVNGAGIKKPLSFEALLGSAEKFYSAAFQQENTVLRSIGVQPLVCQRKNGASLIRLGRHSGAESVTIETHRQIRIMQAKGKEAKFEKGATTLWLAANSSNPEVLTHTRPFGWVSLEPITEEIQLQMKSKFEERKVQKESQANITEKVDDGTEPQEEKAEARKTQGPVREVWKQAVLSWRPDSEIITAVSGIKKAQGKGKSIVPESVAKMLFAKKKKPVIADVEVEPIGTAFRITKIEPIK